MSKTPYNDLSSQDILSAHISGIQHDVNKLQEVLNLQTSSEVGHVLNPVNDQDDPALRYRIYEGTIRNWLDEPIPVIYRNGSVVNSAEYTLQAPYGCVLFTEQQNSNDTITADFERINSDSKTVSDIYNSINSVQSPGTRMVQVSGMWASHNRDGYADIWSDTMMAANLLDAFPFPVGYEMTLDAIAVRLDIIAGTNGSLAIYKDGGGYPSELIVNGGTFDTTTTGWKVNAINATLQPGLYWLVRNQDNACAMVGYRYQEVIPIGIDIYSIPWNVDTGDMSDAGYFGGYRVETPTGLDGNWPSVFPSGAVPFSRARYASVFVRRA